ncbi:MAG: nuclear transport factor 2 family protein [Thermoleophilaceae bacterium]|nr:nuclear transport factor 2 family protein [Thermoleophilaceae bacterium]
MFDVTRWRAAYEAFRDGDVDAFIGHCDEQIEWHTRWPGLESVYHGHDGLREWHRKVLEPMEFHTQMLDAEPLDEARALLHFRLEGTGRGSGVEVAMEVWYIWTLRGDKLVRSEVFYEREQALAAVGPAP